MAVYGEPVYLPVYEEHPLNPISPYGLSKVRGEMYCQTFSQRYGINPVMLRYFNTYGSGQSPSPYVGVMTTFINQVLRGEPITVFGDGSQTRDFVWVGDVARASVLAALSDASGVFNIASGTETSINEVADMVIETVGEGRKVYGGEPGGEVTRIVADISEAEIQLGYQPRGELSALLQGLVDWWRESLMQAVRPGR
jgi:UDP-glucose 4-epimerase